MKELFHNPFLVISIFSPLLPLFIGYRKKLTLLWWYCLTGLTFEILITVTKRVFHLNYYVLANLFLLIEFVFINLLFQRKIFRSSFLFFTVLISSGILFIVLNIYKSVFQLNLVGGSVFQIMYIIYGILGLYTTLKKQEFPFLDKYWFFWACIAFVIYAAGSFFVFLFRDILIQDNTREFMRVWTYIYLTLNILKNILLAIAIYRYSPSYNKKLA